jgi:polysaccharide chain length determinant protein (PEP-CTERM system associated)
MTDDPRHSESNIRDAIWRRRWLAITIGTVVLATAAALIVSLPDVYRASATVLVQREEVAEAFVRSSVTGELETRLQTIGEKMLSRMRLEALITQFGLYPALRKRGPIEEAVDRMRKDIKVEPREVPSSTARPATVAFTLSYIGTDPLTVARVTNSLAASYVEENQHIRNGQAHSTAEVLKGQLDELKLRLDAQNKDAATLRARYGTELPEQATANLAAIERLNTELRVNRDNRQRAADRRDALRQDPAAAARPPGDVTPGSKRLTDLREELAQLRARFTDQYPDVARVQMEIARLERQPALFAGGRAPAPGDGRRPATALADADQELQRLDREAQALTRQIATYERRLDNAPRHEQEIKQTSQEYGNTAELYYSLLKRYEDARLAENLETRPSGEQFRVLDSALPPTEPAAPNRLQLLLLAGVLSIVAAAGAIFAAEQLDTSFHSLDDLRAFTRIPVLATVPPIVTARDRAALRWRFAAATVGVACALTLIAFVSRHLAGGNVPLVLLLARGKI